MVSDEKSAVMSLRIPSVWWVAVLVFLSRFICLWLLKVWLKLPGEGFEFIWVLWASWMCRCLFIKFGKSGAIISRNALFLFLLLLRFPLFLCCYTWRCPTGLCECPLSFIFLFVCLFLRLDGLNFTNSACSRATEPLEWIFHFSYTFNLQNLHFVYFYNF